MSLIEALPNLCNITPGTLSGRERTKAMARISLSQITPFDVWLREAPRSDYFIELYSLIVAGLKKESIDPSPRWFEFKDGILVSVGY